MLFSDVSPATAGGPRAATAWVELPHTSGRPALLLATLAALLHRYTEQTTVAIDLVSAGLAISPLAFEVVGETSLAQLAEQAQAGLDEAAAGRRAPLPPSNIAACFIEGPAGGAMPGSAAPAAAAPGDALHFVFALASDGARLSLVDEAGSYGATLIDQLVESFVRVLDVAGRQPGAAIDVVPLVGPRTWSALATHLDGGRVEHPHEPVHCQFAAHARAQPQALAASFQDHHVTYGELDERSSRLAHALVDRGLAPGQPVAVCMRPGLPVLVAMLAIWKARGIYLPLDPTHPPAHIGRMIEEARPCLALTVSDVTALIGATPQLHLDAAESILAGYPGVAPIRAAQLDDPAYLFYTSGTTGRPKGVLANHRNLVQYIHSAARRFGFRAQDVFCSLARITFSISLFELVSPLCCGASLRIVGRDEVLSPERLRLALEPVTVLHAGPSLLGSLFRHLRGAPAALRTLPAMRHASSGGDMVPPAIMAEMKAVFPNAELFVIYGCTEVSCMGTTFAIPRDAVVSRSFVGQPFANMTLRVLDARRNPVPFGVVGEICFAGDGVVPGYLDQPALTAQKFVPIDGLRYYQTGDMGRLHPDGQLEILGRRDFQVQLRGIRIELAGIEQTVIGQGLAAQCAVVARSFGADDVRLVAFVVSPTESGIGAFRRRLGAELPDDMLPQALVVLDALPVTANGKLDRAALQTMPLPDTAAGSGPAAPTGGLERQIAEIFAGVLRRPVPDVDENFFDMGGDSLLGVVVLEEIRRLTGVAVAPGVLFDEGSVAALARQVRQSDSDPGPRPVALNAGGGEPIFMLSGVHVYRKLAQRLVGQHPAYGVFTRREVGPLERQIGPYSVRELAAEYLDLIRRQQPRGPYHLLGYSFAGIVAYEAAQQLRGAGETVGQLFLVDSYLPEWLRGWSYRLAQVARFTSAPPRDVLNFVLRRLRGRRMDREFAGLHQDDATLGPLERRRDTVNLAAAGEYMAQLRPYEGRVDLIVSSARLREDPLKDPGGGWRPYIRQLDIHTIDAHHLRMISDEPYVSEVAAIVAAHRR